MMKKMVLSLGLICFLISNAFGKGEEEDFLELEQIVVTATRAETTIADLPTNVNIITKDEIARSNAQTVAEAIENALGITEVSQRGTRGSTRDVRIRSGGDTSKQVLVMINGQPINDVALGSADLEEIPVDGIERIEIIRGPGSALWGANALGGVINIITKEPREEEPVTNLRYTGGSFATQRYNFNIEVNKDGKQVFISAVEDFSDGWRENSDYRGSDITMKASDDYKQWGTLGILFMHHQSKFGMPGKNTTPIEEYDGETEKKAQSPDARMEKDKKYGQLEYKNTITGESILKLRVYGNLSEKRYEHPTAYTDDLSQGSSYGLEFQADAPYEIVIGGDIHRDEFKRENLTITPSIVNIDKNTLNQSIFLQKTLSIKRISTIGGVRYDHHSVFGGQTNPRFSIVYHPIDSLKLSGNLGRAFRAPTFEDLYSPYTDWPASEYGPAGDTQGNTDLKPERAWGYDIGVEYQLKDILVTRATFYRNDIEDLIAWDEVDPDPNYDKWRPSNVGNAYNQGVEAEITHWILKNLSEGISYTYLDSKGKKKGQEDYKTLMYSPPHRVNYRINYKTEFGFGANINVNYIDRVEWEDDYGSVHELPSYTLVNGRICQKIRGFEIFFAADNIFDKKYQSREDYPLPGRSFTGGMSMEF